MVTGWMTTGPRVGSSSVAWDTPAGAEFVTTPVNQEDVVSANRNF